MIRNATPDDAGAIHLLTSDLGYSTSPETVSHQLEYLLSSEAQKVQVFEHLEQPAGWIQFGKTFRVGSEPFVEITGLVVSKRFRRLGIATALVNQAMTYAASENMKLRVRCNSQRADAHRFYRSLGFTVNKQQTVFELS